MLGDSMKIELVLPDTVRAGEPVPVTLRVVNTGSRHVTLYTQGRPTTFDIVVSRPDHKIVWHRLYHAVVNSILQVRKLAPGEILEFSDSWNQRANGGAAVTPGEYRVTGVLPTNPPDELRSRTAQLRILPDPSH
jgi:hypothetical protein